MMKCIFDDDDDDDNDDDDDGDDDDGEYNYRCLDYTNLLDRLID